MLERPSLHRHEILTKLEKPLMKYDSFTNIHGYTAEGKRLGNHGTSLMVLHSC